MIRSPGRLVRHVKRLPLCALIALTISTTAVFAQTAQNTTSVFQYDANGNLTKRTDPNAQATTLIYDPLNRLTQQVQPAPAIGIPTPTLGMSYDGRDQLSSVTDPRSLVTRYTNDGLGNQTTLTSPDTGTTSRTYDLAGNLTSSTDARGKKTTYTYDALNRVTSITYATGVATTFEYDGGTTGAPNAKGHLTKVTDESGSTTYRYDGFGRLVDKEQTVTASGSTFGLLTGYGTAGNAIGKMTQLTYPSGNRIEMSYDTAGRINAIAVTPTAANGLGTGSNSVPLLSAIRYHPFGAPISWTWGNSTSTSANTYARGVDLDGRITSFPLGNGVSNGLIRTLNYDPASRIIGMSHSGSGTGTFAPANFDQNFTYDNLGRLLSVSGANTQAFQYDASGNRTLATFGSTAYTNTINPANNQLTATSGPAPAKTNQYDAAGNLTTDGSVAFSFSSRGRRQSATVSKHLVTYLYNGFGQRVVKSGATTLVLTGKQQYVYDEVGHLIGEYNASGKMVQETVYLGDMPVAVFKQIVTGTAPNTVTTTQIYYVYADQINTPRVITRATDNQIVWRWDATDPFGLAQPNENPAALGTFIYNPRFPGQLYDRETNLNYNYFRDYDPQQGRYVESDLIGLDGGVNTYAYVEGNPVSFTDPSGLFPNPAEAACALGPNPVCAGGIVADIATWMIAPSAVAGATAYMTSERGAGPIQMAKGGNQNKDNEYSRAARLQQDPCDWLKKQYNGTTDSTQRQKIKTAQKVLGCRKNSSTNEDCDK